MGKEGQLQAQDFKQCRLNELKVRPVAPPPMWLDDGQGGTATGAGLQAVSAQWTQGKTSGATTNVVGRWARRDSYRRRTSKQCRLNELKVRPVAPPPMWLDDGQGGTATGAGLQAVSAQRTQGKTSGATTDVVGRWARRDSYRRRTSSSVGSTNSR